MKNTVEKNMKTQLTGSHDGGSVQKDTGLLGSHEPRTADTVPLRLPASSVQWGYNRGIYMASYHFDTQDACDYGVEQAVLLYNLCFWIRHNEANGTNFIDGRYWTYNSAKAFESLFPFWNSQKIARLLREMESNGLIVSANHNKAGFDKTKWYSVLKSACLNLKAPLLKNEQPIPDINTDKKQHIYMSVNTPSKKQVSKFIKPTVEEISSYIKERVAAGKPFVCAEKFFNHYEAVGWKVGRAPMKDWKAAVRTWEGNNYGANQSSQASRLRDAI